MNEDENKLVFVSYAHADKEFLDKELMPFLKSLVRREQIELWSDQLIGVGDDWYAQITARLDQAKVAILLVTEPFLASDFCQSEEIPVLLQRARRGELTLLPLLVEPCSWREEPWLRRLQMAAEEGKSLIECDTATRKRILTDFAKQLRGAVEGTPGVRKERPNFDKPHPTRDLHRLPQTGSLLFGRRKELKLLDTAWDNADTNLVAFTAGGGVGKSTLARVWAETLAEDGWRGAERAFAWSFYSQGTGRMTDAESFIAEALEWFGDDTPQGLSLWDRGERLADCVRRRRTLLILDGVEPLQSSDEGVDRGSIRDPGLRTLVEELARDNPGLCVVTTRERLADLKEQAAPAVLHQDLDQVSKRDGRALLRVEGIQGDDEALEAAVEDLGGHALAVSLLRNLLTDGNDAPHISNARALPALAHPVEEGGHPRRVLDAWATRLGEGAELELLHIIGLFDRPAARAAVLAVIEGKPLRGLNRRLRTASLDDVLERLKDAGLIALPSTREDTLDAHPIVREHFGKRLEAQNTETWRTGHRRLYEHHKNEADHQPNDLAGMQPLFAAVVHGCAAGLHQEVCDQVYHARINRGEEYYLVRRLGAYAAGLSCLSHFFAEPWNRPEPALASADQSWVLAQAGAFFRAVGRVREAAGPMAEALHLEVTPADWQNASISAGNLSELYLVLGELAQAQAYARDAVDHADKSGLAFERLEARATQANVLHHLGQTSEARTLFAIAEGMAAEHQVNVTLEDRYCDLLLAEGEADEVLRRAEQELEWTTGKESLLTIALNHLSLGCAHTATSPPNSAVAEQHLQAAVDGLRTSGSTHFLPRGLLARAQFHRTQGRLDLAQRDLDGVRTLVRRTGMRLYEADLELEQARCHLANDDPDSARNSLAKAKQLVESMNYGRRRPEVEALEAELSSGDPPASD